MAAFQLCSCDLQAGYLMCEPGRIGFADGVVPLNLAVRVIPSMVRHGNPCSGAQGPVNAPAAWRILFPVIMFRFAICLGSQVL
jgi:hypothetical protein